MTRRLIITLTVFALLIGGALLPDRADAAGLNWFARDCNRKATATACVIVDQGVDDLFARRTILLRDESGATVTIRTGGQLWALAKAHSHKCVMKGDLKGCYYVDSIGGKAVVLPDGNTVTTRFFH